MLSTETTLDLRYNIAALTIAICSDSNIFHRVDRYKIKKEKELSDGHLKSSAV